MCGSNKNILSNEKWGVFYVRVPAFKPGSDWKVVETAGMRKIKFADGTFYVPKNGVGIIKIRKKVDIGVFKGPTFVKTGEDYTYRIILLGDFGIRMINADPEVDGISDPSPKNLLEPEVPGEFKWVVIENTYGDHDYLQVLTEEFVIDEGEGKKVIISPKRLEIV